MTGGQAVPLASSHLLPKVVLGATVEEAGLAPLRAEVRDQVIQVREERGRDLTEAEMEEAVASIQRNLRASGRGGRVQHMSHDGALQATHAQTYWDAPTLAVASSSIPMEARGASGSTFVEGRGGSLFSGGVDRGMAPAPSRRGSMARGRGGRGSSYAAATACPPSPESTFLPTFGATLFGSAAPAAAPAAGSAPAMEVSVREDEISVEQVRRMAMPYSRRGPSAT
uniref:Uncharacterized protein n=1 Tax=Chromera velia CCMP2878 TaxID=1169474 RepID=A0A0G4I7Q4_9ALVE|eukprot:Cvel_11721.t1-p1 / transcript=Cvel_11721.t1 / gene=Cvel_11721 / organism=Chromera_velia_CCMP2878 / gene_product=hypothetical protein / transcript_product=hypothetical protein / location=Cvel_scaffold743:68559-69233(+) / protein_length=225 / sequence_SO=supercontig / SO=protein_coding / is_pseudo=false